MTIEDASSPPAPNETHGPVDLVEVERRTLLLRVAELEQQLRVAWNEKWDKERERYAAKEAAAIARGDLATMRATVEVYEATHAVLLRSDAARMRVTLLLAAQTIGRRNRHLSKQLGAAAHDLAAAMKETK